MKKMKRAHLWIGLIASVLIFMESITGLLMNEPWLIGQSQVEGVRGNFQQGQFSQGQAAQGSTANSGQAAWQTQGQADNQLQGQTDGQMQGQNGANGNGQFQGRPGFGGNRNFPAGVKGEGMGQGSLMSTIRGLHAGRIGNTNVKWLIDLAALAMMFLTGSGIYLSVQILRADRKRKKRQEENPDVFVN